MMFRFINSPGLFPPSVRHVSATFQPELWSSVTQDEAAACRSMLGNAVTHRLSEFVAGRRCAVRALEWYPASTVRTIGAIGRRADRSPIWPAGIVGSITHAKGYAAAAVSDAVRAIGIDTERLLSADEAAETAATIGSEQEIKQLATTFSTCDRLALTMLFSAKESLFKCLFPLTSVWFEFRQACLVGADAGCGSVTLELTTTLSSAFVAGWRGVGAVRVNQPYVHTGFLLDRDGGGTAAA